MIFPPSSSRKAPGAAPTPLSCRGSGLDVAKKAVFWSDSGLFNPVLRLPRLRDVAKTDAARPVLPVSL